LPREGFNNPRAHIIAPVFSGWFVMRRSKGNYSKHGRNFRSQGRATITRLLRSFKVGDRVRITPDPAFKKGRPNNLRFKNKTGIVQARRGKAYEVVVKDGDKPKLLLVTNLHLTRVEGA